jgi:DNA-binding SARP family transcriptional activator
VKLLALAPGHRLPREEVLAMLWPQLGTEAAASNLHKAASYTRRALGDAGAIVCHRALRLRDGADRRGADRSAPRREPDVRRDGRGAHHAALGEQPPLH